MSAKHTAGPWHRNIKPASHYPVIFAGRNKHIVTAVPARGIPEDEAEANHNLLTAAPEMLRALRFIADHSNDPGVVREAEAAIAKAEGRAP